MVEKKIDEEDKRKYGSENFLEGKRRNLPPRWVSDAKKKKEIEKERKRSK